MAAFAVIVMFTFTVVHFILKLSGEGNEDVSNLDWVGSVGLAFVMWGRGEWGDL